MERDRVLEMLPETYAAALRLREAGVEDAGIAERLSIPLQAVDAVLHLAEAKLARLLELGDPGEMPADGPGEKGGARL